MTMWPLAYLAGAFRPGTFFDGKTLSLRRAVIALALLLLVAAGLLYLTGLIYGEDTFRAGGYTLRKGEVLSFKISSPPDRLFFPLYWTAYLLFVGFVRYGFFTVFAERTGRMAESFAITTVATVPLAIAAAIQGLLNNLAPVFGPEEDMSNFLLGLRVFIGLGLYATAFFFEGRASVAGLRRVLGQTRPVAVLIWAAPVVGVLFIVSLFIVVGYIQA